MIACAGDKLSVNRCSTSASKINQSDEDDSKHLSKFKIVTKYSCH